MFKVSKGNSRKKYGTCSKLTTKTLFIIVKFEHILHLSLVFLSLTFNRQMFVGHTYQAFIKCVIKAAISRYSLEYSIHKIHKIDLVYFTTRVWHERHQCDASVTRVQKEWDTSNTSATQVRQECDTSATRTTRMPHGLKNVDFDNYTSKNIFSHPYIYYMASERLQGEEQFHSKHYLWKFLIPMPKCVWKVHHKNWTL